MNRRALFFVVAAAVCVVLVPLTVPTLRYVPKGLGAIYVVLALLSYADARANR